MRVALVYQYFGLTESLERERVQLAKALVRLGVEVDCYSDPRGRVELPNVNFHDVVPAIRSTGRLGSAVEYASFARRATGLLRRARDRYDVIDVSGTTAWEHDVIRVHAVQRAVFRRWPSLGGADFRAARVRATLSPFTRPRMGLAEAIERLQYRPGRFRRALAATDEVARDLGEIHGVPADLVEVIHYPVDTERLARPPRGTLRANLGLPPTAPLLLFVGHNFRRKGLDVAIRAMVGLRDDVHLLIIGNGERRAFEKLASASGLDGRVHFVGSTTVPEAALAEAEIFVLPTREDVWGIALIEAMAAGIPIVTTEAAGAAGVVRSAGAGIIVPAGSVRMFREAVGSLLAEPERRRELARRGPPAAAPFSVEAFAEAVLRAYEHTLKRGPSDSQI